MQTIIFNQTVVCLDHNQIKQSKIRSEKTGFHRKNTTYHFQLLFRTTAK